MLRTPFKSLEDAFSNGISYIEINCLEQELYIKKNIAGLMNFE